MPGRAREVTFLLTDIEGSTKLWEQHPREMSAALTQHEALFAEVVPRHGGSIVKSKGEGDSVFCTFDDPAAAVAAAVDLQRSLASAAWPTPRPVKVRMSIHTGEAELRDGDWYGQVVNRAARIRAVAHGGQVVVSEAAVTGSGSRLGDGVELLDLGERRLKDLAEPEHIWQILHPDLPATFPPVRSLDERPHNLPEQPTPLVGRDDLLAEGRRMLTAEGVRLLTLTGPGGVGKTRLAVQLAADVLDTFDDGVFAVWLAGAVSGETVAHDVADALGVEVPPGSDPADAVVGHLEARHLLLVLDNAEHVLDAVADLVTRVIADCPPVSVVVTSREWLHLRAEHELDVPPLALPAPDDEIAAGTVTTWPAPALFFERVAAVRRDVVIDDDAASAGVEICRRLDGLPLALELAAARVRKSSIADVRDSLASALEALSEGPRDLPDRQRALRSTIAWSYDLLSNESQDLLRRLAVFAGGWMIDAAIQVTGLAPERVEAGLADLIAHNLVRQDSTVDDAERRWAMLETIRQFALDALDQSSDRAACEDGHGEWCVSLARVADDHLTGPDQIQWVARLATEHDNLRRALDVHHGTDRFVALAGALTRFWAIRGYWKEGRQALEAAVASGAGTDADRIRALIGAGHLAELVGTPTLAGARYGDALELAESIGDEASVAIVHHRLGAVARGTGELDEASEHYRRSREIRTRLSDERGLGMLDSEEGTLALVRGDIETAERRYASAASHLREAGDQRELAAALGNGARMAIRRRHWDRAISLLEEAAATSAELGDVQRELNHQILLAKVLIERRELADAERLADEVRRRAESLGQVSLVVDALQLSSMVATHAGRPEAAVQRREEIVEILRQSGDTPSLCEQLARTYILLGLTGRGDAAVAVLDELLGLCETIRLPGPLASVASELVAKPEDERGPDDRPALSRCVRGLLRIAVAGGDHERATLLVGAAGALGIDDADGGIVDVLRRALGGEQFDALRSEGASLGPRAFASG